MISATEQGRYRKSAAALARVLLLGASLSTLLASCALDNTVPLTDPGPRPAAQTAPAVPSVDPRPLPSEAPRGFGIETRAATEYRRLVSAFGGEYRNERLRTYLEPLLQRVAKSSEDPAAAYRLTLLNSPSVNAFALPSGDIFVSRGLLALANDSSEIAAVLAHESRMSPRVMPLPAPRWSGAPRLSAAWRRRF